MKEGTKRLEVTMFQWTPDHLAATSFFERASDAYKGAGDLLNARLQQVAAADSHEASGASAACAVALTKAAKLALDHSEIESDQQKPIPLIKEATRLYLRAAQSWGEHGDVFRAGECTFKAAVEIEDVNLAKSLEFYQRAITLVYPLEDTTTSTNGTDAITTLPPMVIDMCREYFTTLLRRDLLQEALLFTDRLIALFTAFESHSSLCKTLVAVSVLQLKLGDVVAAHDTYIQKHRSYTVYPTSTECRLAENLIMAFVRLDIEALQSAQNSVDMRYIDKEVVGIARGLSLFAAKNGDELRKEMINSKDDSLGAEIGDEIGAAEIEEDEIDLT